MTTNNLTFWKKFKQNKLAYFGFIFITFVTLLAVFGYLITPDDSPMANKMNLALSIKKPGAAFTFLTLPSGTNKKSGLLQKMLFGEPNQKNTVAITKYAIDNGHFIYQEYLGAEESIELHHIPIKNFGENTTMKQITSNYIFKQTFWFGTDVYGRDILSRIIIGARVSLIVGLMAVIISLTLGLFLGAMAGYFGGKIDAIISWFINVLWSLPALLLVIAISFALGKGFWQVFIAIGISLCIEVARLVRGQFISMRNAQFVEAAKALGYSNFRIIFKHILPNILGPLTVIAAANFASAILLEAGLSFLGFGAAPPTPTWGAMIKEHYGYIIIDAAYLAVIPGLSIMLLVYAFNLITLGLRDVFDIKSQEIHT